jgi:hypothetical protein
MLKSKTDTVLKRLYPLVLAISLFTGFGNMPIYKRYYIASIPGLGWSGDFYLNLYVHYIAGALLLAIAVYYILIYFKKFFQPASLSVSGQIRAIALCAVLLTGILLAMRNLDQFNLSFGSQMAAAFAHLAAAIFLMLFSIACTVMKSPWRRTTS